MMLLYFVPSLLGLAVLSFIRPTFKTLTLLELPGVIFIFGLCALVIPCTIGYLFQERILLCIGGAMVIAALICFKNKHTLNVYLAEARKGKKHCFLLFLFILFGVYSYYLGNYMHLGSDSTRHIAYIKKFTETGKILTDNFQLSATLPVDELLVTYVYNAIFPLFAFVAQVTKIDPILIWKHSASVFAFVTLSAFYSASMRFFYSHFAAVLSVMMLIIYWSINLENPFYGILALRSISYPNRVSVLAGLLLFSFIYQELNLVSIKRESKINLFIFFTLLGLLPFLHLQAWVYFSGILFILAAILLGTGNSELCKVVWRGIVVFFIISITLILMKFPYYQECLKTIAGCCFNEAVVSEYGGIKFLKIIPLFRWSMLLIFSVFLYLIFLITRKNLINNRQSFFLLPGPFLSVCSILMIIFLMSPLSVNVAAKFLSLPIVARLTWLLDMILILLNGYILSCIIENMCWIPKKYTSSISLNACLSLVIAICILVPQSKINYAASIIFNNKKNGFCFETLLCSSNFRRLIEKIDPGSTVLVYDSINDDYLQCFRDVLVSYPTFNLTLPAQEKSKLIDSIFVLNITSQERLNRLRKIPCDYILLRQDERQELALKFDNLMPTLKKIYDVKMAEINNDKQRFILYKVDK